MVGSSDRSVGGATPRFLGRFTGSRRRVEILCGTRVCQIPISAAVMLVERFLLESRWRSFGMRTLSRCAATAV